MTDDHDDIYTPENVPLCEALYGEGLISLGGYGAVDQMFRGISLRGKRLLDIGSGIGGIPNYLAQHYHCEVVGLDVHPWMVDYSMDHADMSVRDKLRFICYREDGSIPLESESIDLIYSKGVLTNVEDKRTLFKEIYRIAKPGGRLCLIDWLVPDTQAPHGRTLQTGEQSYKENPVSYKKLLAETGFENVVLDDVSEEYLSYAYKLHERLCCPNHMEEYRLVLGDEIRGILLQSNQTLINSIESGNQLSMRILAWKPESN